MEYHDTSTLCPHCLFRHEGSSPCESVTEDDVMRCPYCHHLSEDTDFRGSDTGSTECEDCEKTFRYRADYTIHWTTTPVGDVQ